MARLKGLVALLPKAYMPADRKLVHFCTPAFVASRGSKLILSSGTDQQTAA